jgi:hypothetical protein
MLPRTEEEIRAAYAKDLAKQDLAGWLMPDGRFVECCETGSTIPGLSLGRHEATALKILDAHRELMRELVCRRNRLGCLTWPETTRHNLIKEFMREQGFIRVAPDILDLYDFD